MEKKKHQHPTRIFKTPEELLNAWNEYKVFVDTVEAKKWAKVTYTTKGERKVDEQPMPYDMDGFVAWYHKKYNKHIHQYLDGTYYYGDDFLVIVTHIKAERNGNLKTGGLLGFFNSNITNRVIGLADQTQTEITGRIETITGMEIK
jgi:hypothetical protein